MKPVAGWWRAAAWCVALLRGAVLTGVVVLVPAAAQQRPPAAPAVASGNLVRLPGPPGEHVAVLQGLDKVTARAQRIVVRVGSSVKFGTLSVTVDACLVNAPDAPPESAAHLVVIDEKPGNPANRLFAGWMFASAPALSGIDHSVYDLTVLACSTAAQAQAGNR